jgi:hypothetical protein
MDVANSKIDWLAVDEVGWKLGILGSDPIHFP